MEPSAYELFDEAIQKSQVWLKELGQELDVKQLLPAELRELWPGWP